MENKKIEVEVKAPEGYKLTNSFSIGSSQDGSVTFVSFEIEPIAQEAQIDASLLPKSNQP